MQFANVSINGSQHDVFALTKAELAVFLRLGKERKAPEDEQAVRFCCYDSVPIVWYTSGTLLASLMTPSRPNVSAFELNVLAATLKAAAVKAKVASQVLISVTTSDLYIIPKLDLKDGAVVQVIDAPIDIATATAIEWGQREFDEVAARVDEVLEPDDGSFNRKWVASGEVVGTLADIATATNMGELAWVFPKADSDVHPVVVTAADDVDGALWRVAFMTRDKR